MGTFRVECEILNLYNRDQRVTVAEVLVDTGSEYTWISRSDLQSIEVAVEKKDLEFVMANGQKITRSIGFAIVQIGKDYTVDEVVFAEEGDLLLLGARTLEGLNLAVDPSHKKLVAAGPLPAA